MRIFPPQVEIGPDEGFSEAKDIFDLKEFGEGLTRLIEEAENPMAMVLDGSWGSGKTTFIKMWSGHLRNNGFPVIYFDAFANDFMDDAFAAIAGEVISLLSEKKEKGSETYEKFLDKALKVGEILIRSSKAGALALDILDAANSKSISGGSADKEHDQASGYLKNLLENHKRERVAVEEFKEALKQMASELTPGGSSDHANNEEGQAKRRPLVFVIDELDRCKPVFALSLLEKIKHFFLVEGVHFVLVANLRQLESSVKQSYGNETDARTYLQKFYHLVLSLPEKKGPLSNHKVSIFIEHIFKKFSDKDEIIAYIFEAKMFLTMILINKPYSLRAIEKITTHVLVIFCISKDKHRDPFFIAGLCVLKVMGPELYQKAKDGTLTFEEIEGFLRFDEWSSHGNVHIDMVKKKWRWCLDNELPEDGTDWHDLYRQMGMKPKHRKTLIQDLCRKIDSIQF